MCACSCTCWRAAPYLEAAIFADDADGHALDSHGGGAALRVVAVHCRVPWPRPPASCQPKSPASVNGVPDPGPHFERAGATLRIN
eukprot:scaffold62683_cov57-Phaeocystis_antarctica.AAC.5